MSPTMRHRRRFARSSTRLSGAGKQVEQWWFVTDEKIKLGDAQQRATVQNPIDLTRLQVMPSCRANQLGHVALVCPSYSSRGRSVSPDLLSRLSPHKKSALSQRQNELKNAHPCAAIIAKAII